MTSQGLWSGGWKPCFEGSDALIIVPPFVELHYPSLGAHVLQACVGTTGRRVGVLYANLLFASTFGGKFYRVVSGAIRGSFLDERLFARSAYGGSPLGRNSETTFALEKLFGVEVAKTVYRDADRDLGRQLLEELQRVEADVPTWIETMADYVAELEVSVIGATTTFAPTAAGVALLEAIKRRAPETVAILGGAQCEGVMAQGVAAIAPFVDHIFSGECEASFPLFLDRLSRGERPKERIVKGEPCERMNALPPPNFDEYFEQRSHYSGDPTEMGEPPSLPYETSRGCWWGQKHHCTFCGLNGEGMRFRTKAPDKVIAELKALTTRYGVNEVMMTDNIMPFDYFTSLIPRLPEELPGVSIFYEQKANLSRERLIALKSAGVHMIQPGIEALSTDLLKLMRKGVSASQNLNLLRHARGVGVSVIWNLLWGFAGETLRAYEETSALLQSITHLQPPGGFWPVMIDRFSPYFTEPERFDIHDVHPLPGYADFLPLGAPVEELAYHFMGSGAHASHSAPELMLDIQQAVAAWRGRWASADPPELRIGEHAGLFVLIDTRGLERTERVQALDAYRARQLLTASPYEGSAEQIEAIERRLAVNMDGWLQPLAVVDSATLALLDSGP